MTTETIITIAALLSGSLGWLAFAKEYRLRVWWKDCAQRTLASWQEAEKHHPDRDERGQFVKREVV